MKKGIMAMEGLEDDNIKAPEADDEDATLVATELASERVEASQDRIEESEALGEVLDTTANQLDSAADAQAEPTEELTVAAESFVSYACLRLGVKKPKSVSVESIQGSADKRAQLKKAAADIRTVRAQLDDGLEIAQEGLADDFKAFFATSLKSTTTLKAELTSAITASNEVEGKSNESFEAGWVEHLGVPGVATPDAVERLVARYAKVLGVSGLVTVFDKATSLIKASTTEVRNIWFWSNTREIGRLDALISEIEKEVGGIVPEHAEHSAGGNKARVLSKQEAKKLGEAALVLLDTLHLEHAIAKTNTANALNFFWVIFNSNLRIKDGLIGLLTAGGSKWVNFFASLSPSDSEKVKMIRAVVTAEDLAKAREVAGHAQRARGKIYLTIKNRSLLVDAIIKYIEESTKLRSASTK